MSPTSFRGFAIFPSWPLPLLHNYETNNNNASNIYKQETLEIIQSPVDNANNATQLKPRPDIGIVFVWANMKFHAKIIVRSTDKVRKWPLSSRFSPGKNTEAINKTDVKYSGGQTCWNVYELTRLELLNIHGHDRGIVNYWVMDLRKRQIFWSYESFVRKNWKFKCCCSKYFSVKTKKNMWFVYLKLRK